MTTQKLNTATGSTILPTGGRIAAHGEIQNQRLKTGR
jgi:hypothetical protein